MCLDNHIGTKGRGREEKQTEGREESLCFPSFVFKRDYMKGDEGKLKGSSPAMAVELLQRKMNALGICVLPSVIDFEMDM